MSTRAIAEAVLREVTPADLTRLQRLSGYPMVSVLLPTTPGARLGPVDQANLDALVERAARACSVIGEVVVNEPFAGSYIPLRHFGRDNRVSSVMVDLRRDMYLRDDGSLDPEGAGRISEALVAILRA